MSAIMTSDALASGAHNELALNHPHGLRGFIHPSRWTTCLDIPMQLAVSIAMPPISLDLLLSLRAGMVVESTWQASQDVPLLVEEKFLASVEFEPVGDRLGVRINNFQGMAAQDSMRSQLPLPIAEDAPRGTDRNHALEDLKLTPQLRFGIVNMPMRDVLDLCVGDTVVLDRPVIAPVTIAAGGRVVAHGDLVLVKGAFAVQIGKVSEMARHLPGYYSAF